MAYSNISKGDSGDKVKRIQKHLKHIEYYTGEITGTFDDATENAVKAFQKANSLPETGVVDYKTLSLLAAKSKEKGPIVVKKAENKPKTDTVITTETGRWNNHTFVVASNLIRSFSDLSIKGGSEMESKDKGTQGYVTRKGGNPTEVSMSVLLNQYAGCEVRDEAMKWVEEARNGATDYFYVGNKKLAEYKFMLTDASVQKVEISPKGTWITATVNLTLKQSNGTTSSGSSSGGSGSSGGGSGGYSGGYSGGSGGGSVKYSVNTSAPATERNIPEKNINTPADLSFNHINPLFGKSSPMPTGTTTKTTTQQKTATGQRDANYYRDLGKDSSKSTKSSTTFVLFGIGGPGH